MSSSAPRNCLFTVHGKTRKLAINRPKERSSPKVHQFRLVGSFFPFPPQIQSSLSSAAAPAAPETDEERTPFYARCFRGAES